MKSKAREEDWLNSLLKSKENRAAHILELAKRNAGVVVTLTVNWPGQGKISEKAGHIHLAGLEAIQSAFAGHIVYEERKSLVTGDEAFFLIRGEAGAVKGQACEIEETHPLGRLFDIDVLGDGYTPISRTALGYHQRRCMVCGGETIVCRRLNCHTQDVLLACIDAMIASWQRVQEGV